MDGSEADRIIVHKNVDFDERMLTGQRGLACKKAEPLVIFIFCGREGLGRGLSLIPPAQSFSRVEGHNRNAI
jgi:hypothetical protein